MGNFYETWLQMWEQSESEKVSSRRSIHEGELDWVETPQDQRAALLVSRDTGFRTWGTTTMLAEIPPHSHSGAHKHGEEAIFIVTGTGYSIVDNVRYDWKEHSVVLVPFGAIHQHFNTGDTTVRYLSAICPDLEFYCGLQRTIQVERWGRTDTAPKVETSPNGMAPGDAYRVVLPREDALSMVGEGDGIATVSSDLPEFDPEHPLIIDVNDDGNGVAFPYALHKEQVLQYMRLNKDLNGFRPLEVEVSGLLIDRPHEYGGMHAHMEAHLYILQGHGYSLINDERVPWSAGTGFHIPGPQTSHRHVNEADIPSVMVRVAFGIRSFFQKAAQREFPYLYLSPRQAVLERSSSASQR